MQLPASSPTALSMASSKYYARTFLGLQGTFAGFRRAYRSPANLREGWQYLYNLNGPIGNSTGYAVRTLSLSHPIDTVVGWCFSVHRQWDSHAAQCQSRVVPQLQHSQWWRRAHGTFSHHRCISRWVVRPVCNRCVHGAVRWSVSDHKLISDTHELVWCGRGSRGIRQQCAQVGTHHGHGHQHRHLQYRTGRVAIWRYGEADMCVTLTLRCTWELVHPRLIHATLLIWTSSFASM